VAWSFAHSDARETRPPAHRAYQAIRLYGTNGNGVYGTALRNGSTDTVFTETVTETDTDERESNAGNKALDVWQVIE